MGSRQGGGLGVLSRLCAATVWALHQTGSLCNCVLIGMTPVLKVMNWCLMGTVLVLRAMNWHLRVTVFLVLYACACEARDFELPDTEFEHSSSQCGKEQGLKAYYG